MNIPYKFNPLGITAEEEDTQNSLTFTATQNSSSVKLNKTGSPNVSGLQYKVGKGAWQAYTIGTTVNLNKDEYVKFRNTANTLSTSTNNFVTFAMTGKISASGDVMSMLNYGTTVPAYGFDKLFRSAAPLVSLPTLSATTVNAYGYQSMFEGCTGLTTVPSDLLPATTLNGGYNYSNMFYGCNNLTNAPNLPAITIPVYCYQAMFCECRKLVTLPTISATTINVGCYSNMFLNCKALTTIPNNYLPVTRLAEYCYRSMFKGCSSLTTVPSDLLPATTLQPYGYCYQSFFEGCTSLTSVINLPAKALSNYCYHRMYFGCTGLTTVPSNWLPATTMKNYCYRSMVQECTHLTSAPDLPATTVANRCYEGMFNGCTALITAPALNATTLVDGCYDWMFVNCTSLVNPPPVLPATTVPSNAYEYMFKGCTSLQHAPLIKGTTINSNALHEMFSGCTSLNAITVQFIAWNYTNSWVYNVAQSGTFTKLTALPETYGTSNIPNGWTVVNSDAPQLTGNLDVTTQWIMPIAQDETTYDDIGPAVAGEYTLQNVSATGKNRIWKRTVTWDNNGTSTTSDLYIWYMPYDENQGFGDAWMITIDVPQYYGMFETVCYKQSNADSPAGLTSWNTCNVSGTGNITIAQV